MQDQNANTSSEEGIYRIGAVSNLSGVPVATLRVWERRYDLVSPPKSNGGHRLYSKRDVHKLTLLKTLTQQGHAISSLSHLSLENLQSMLNDHRSAISARQQTSGRPAVIRLAVVGYGMASRIETQRFLMTFGPTTLKVLQVFSDVQEALSAKLTETPDVWLVHMGSVQASIQNDLNQLRRQTGVRRCILIYHFATVTVLQYLHSSGVIGRREPVSDEELSEIIQSTVYVDNSLTLSAPGNPDTIPARKYSDAVLRRVADISTTVLCECPRHVAELVSMLNSFEIYSQDCLSKSGEDARLHAYLTAVSGSARAMFEQALERIAAHENIDLKESKAR
jgi:DNA-binding transcriptional MerR regulator